MKRLVGAGLLLAAGCAATPPASQQPTLIAVPQECPPPERVLVQSDVVAATQRKAAVTTKERQLFAEAGQYVISPTSSPAVISHLGTLTANATAAMTQLRTAKTLGERAAALPAAEAAVDALSTYLATKGDPK